MNEIQLTGMDGVEDLQFVRDAQVPVPRDGEVLVKVFATSITPTELTWSTNWQNQDGSPRPFPVVPGHDFSGTVALVGQAVQDIRMGLEVYGLIDFWRNGAEAQYTIALPSEIAKKPRSLSHVEAASVPLSGLTAWQALFDYASLKKGESILILGASGGVGIFAVQFAKWTGANVLAATSKNNSDFLRKMGADNVMNYSEVETIASKVDVILDLVGGEIQDNSWPALKEGGIFVSPVSKPSEEKALLNRSKGIYFIVSPNGEQLARIGELIDAGKIVTSIQEVLPLEESKRAFEEGLSHHNRGKTVIKVAE